MFPQSFIVKLPFGQIKRLKSTTSIFEDEAPVEKFQQVSESVVVPVSGGSVRAPIVQSMGKTAVFNDVLSQAPQISQNQLFDLLSARLSGTGIRSIRR